MRDRIVWGVAALVGLGAGGAQAEEPAKADMTTADQPVVITSPDWERKPTGADLDRYYPDLARGRGAPGRATIECTVTADGGLTGCHVVAEEPAGFGFGDATLKLAPSFHMKRLSKDGTPVGGGVVRIPLRWTLGEYESRPAKEAPSYRSVAWAAAPGRADVVAANPQAAAGDVWLYCSMDGERRLRKCRVAGQRPEGQGLGEVALALSERFQAADPLPERGALVAVPFRFGGATQGKLKFVSAPDGAAFLSAYPQAARAAGVNEGKATLACTVVPGGALSGCSVAEESPAGLGFGASALGLADKFRVNPWTEDGEPVDGRAVRLPIRYEDMAEPAATTTDGKTQ